MRGFRGSLGVVVAFALVAAACSGGGGSGSATPSGSTGSRILRTALSEDVGNIDPDNNFEVPGLGVILGMYQGLVAYKPSSSELEGLLATSWEVSKDFATYTFHLRPGVFFHDGTPMTSQSVKDSFERRVQHQTLYTGYFLGDVSSMETPDEQTLVVHLKGPNYAFLDGLASPWGPKVIGPDAIKTHAGSDYSQSWLSHHEDGTGAYELTTYNRGSQYVLQSFDKYWGPKPYFTQVQVNIVPDVGQQILQLKSGELDFIEQYPFSQLASLPSGLKVLSWSNYGMELAIVNTHRITDQATRTAIAAAINPSQWVNTAFAGYGSPALSNFAKAMVAPTTPWTWPASSGPVSGAPNITIAYASNDTSLQSQVANYLIAHLQQVGIHATARVMPTDQFNATAKNPAQGPDISLVHFYPDDAFPGSITYLVYGCGTPLNYLGYCNKAADADFNNAWGTASETARNELFLNGAKIQFDAGAFLGLADIKDVVVYRQGITNLVTYPGLPWNFNYALAREG
jgi:peptide/nickel transport system substrate-binding protein